MFPLRDNVPSRRAPLVTLLLIAANAAAFVHEISGTPGETERLVHVFGVVPARYSDPDVARVFDRHDADAWLPFLTSMFLHGGLLHLASNMWILWIFGDNVEDRMGKLRYLVFYLACGVAAAAVHVLTNRESTIPTIGASGAIAGVMGAYFALFPHSRVLTFLPILFLPFLIEVPAVIFLGIWFATQLWSGTISSRFDEMAGGIAWWAHVGGFVAGLVFFPVFLSREARRERRRD
jgi:membrane associated rhomboid family serine protease